MPETIRCPKCRQAVRVPDTLRDQAVKCPLCMTIFMPQLNTPGTTSPYPARGIPEHPDAVDEPRHHETGENSARDRLVPPAVGLLVVGGLSLMLAVLEIVVMLLVHLPPQEVEKFSPFYRAEIEKLDQPGVRERKAVIAGVFAGLSGLTIIGSIQMFRRRGWGAAVLGCAVAVINFHNCCCLFGLPFGVWGLVVLFDEQVRQSFPA